MTENTTAYMSTAPLEVPLPETETHNHDHDTPVAVSEDNIATVNVSAEEAELEPYKKHYIKEKTKHVHLQGFRKGKAPESMVARLFKDEARQSARDNVLFGKYMKLLQEHKLQPLSEPKVDHIHDKDGKMSATLVVDVIQPVTLGQYLGLEIEAMPPRSTEEALAKTIAEIKQSYPKLTLVEDGLVDKGNVVVADFIVTDAGKELERQENFKISVGVGLYYKPFEDQLIGLKTGENKEFDISFPVDYHKEEFRDKNIHFNLTAKEIKTISEYTNEELAKVLNYETEEKMVELLKQEIENKYKDDEFLFYENQILGQLLSAHQFKIPRKLIEKEIMSIRAEHPNLPPEQVEEVAERFVRTDMVLHSIYERHPEIHMTQEDFNKSAEKLAAKANDTLENTLQKLNAAGKLQRYVDYLTNSRVITFLIDMAEKKEAQPPVENNTVEENKDNG